MNRVRRYWPVPAASPLALIDSMSIFDAEKCGLITQEESEYLREAFISKLSAAFDEQRFVSAADIHDLPNSEIVRRLRKGGGQLEAGVGYPDFSIP